MYTKYKKGFTLVEIMVVVSIIAFISSIVSFSLAQARAKAQDTSRVANVQQLRTAILAYKLDHNGIAPPMPSGVTVPITDRSQAFATTLQSLVDGKYIPSLPKNLGIFYYNAGNGGSGEDATVVGTTLNTGTPTLTGQGGTCRPFNQGGNNIASNCHVTNGYIICDYVPPSQNTECPEVPPPPPPAGDGPGQQAYLEKMFQCQNEAWAQQYFDADTPTQCNNQIDDDGDGLIDYPEDAGCATVNDNNETNQTAAYCSNAVANSDYCMCI